MLQLSQPSPPTTLCLFSVFVLGCGAASSSVSLEPAVAAQADTKIVTRRVATLPATSHDCCRATDWFEDVTGRSGVDWTYRNGREAGRHFMIESFGGGAAAIDFDRDGDCDLFITGGGEFSAPPSPVVIAGHPAVLFRNQGDWQFDNVTKLVGLGRPGGYSQGCAVGDFDADGFPDLFVCGYGGSQLYRNSGDGTYAQLERWGPSLDKDWTTAAIFADFDHDGLPDLVIARYADWSPAKDVNCTTAGVRDLCGPTSYAGTTCLAFRNRGDESFIDATSQAGLRGPVHGLAVVAADLNLDGWVDLFVASDVTPNQLYVGGAELPLRERGVVAGVAFNEWGQAEGSMGVEVADANGDGRPDVWVTNFEREDNAMYLGIDNGLFLHSSAAVGLAGVSRMNVGFGTHMTDFDGDGWPDLFVLNGNPIYAVAESPFEQAPQLFRNVQGRFIDVSDDGGTFFREVHSGRGSAVADFDNDGALDLVVVPMNKPVRLLRNHKTPENFVRVQLAARQGEADATGARVSLEFQGRQLVQFLVRGAGFFSQSDPRLVFPVVRGSQAVEITVQWPAREREIFRGLTVCESHLLIEGHGETLRD